MNRRFLAIGIACIIVLLPYLALAQVDATITGVVTDETGAPLIGANVYLPELTIGAATDANGLYRFVVPAAQALGQEVTLEARFIGYTPRTERITLNPGTITTNFTLDVDVLELGEVVVTGLGMELNKAKLGVNITKVSDKTIVSSDETNVVSALAAKVAGVEVTQTSGEPGASSYIRIRGATTLDRYDTQPLFVVDGIPVNNEERYGLNNAPFYGTGDVVQQNRANDLNAEDIASIEVLKGAAASAVYGSRAANGVVLITTKSGQPGRPRLSYKMSYSFDDVKQSARLQHRYGHGVNGVSPVIVPGVSTTSLTWGPELAPGTETYDHAFELFETGHKFENNLQVSGGTEKTTYFLSFGRINHDGVIKGPNSDYVRNSVHVKATQRLSPKLSFSGNVLFSDVNQDRVQRGSNTSGLLLGAFRTPPDYDNMPYLDPETGLHQSYRLQIPTSERGSRGYDNPFWVAYKQLNSSDVGRSVVNAEVEYDPLDWVNISYRLGYDYASDERQTVIPIGSSDKPDGRIVSERFFDKEIDGTLAITAVKSFRPADMSMNLTLGQNLNQREFSRFSVLGDNMQVAGFNQADNTVAFDQDFEFAEKQRTESYFARLFLDLWGQLYLTGSIRNDGSSTYGSSERRHWYPSVSAGWEFTQLPALRGINWLNFGKLRTALGWAGRQPDPYDVLTTFGSGSFVSGWGSSHSASAFGYGGYFTSVTKGQLDIKPEQVKELELGMDLGLFSNRAGFDFTYYNAKTTDALFLNPLPPSSGSSQQLQNAGEIENEGIELGFTLLPINKKDLKWNIRAIYARNDNTVTRLRDVTTGVPLEFIPYGGFTDSRNIAKEGYPVGVIYGTDFIRFGRGLEVDEVNIDEAYPQAPDGAIYLAEDGYPLFDPQFRIIGDPNPDWIGSVRNTFTLFNKLEISGLIDIKNGGDIYNGTKGALFYFGTHEETADNRGGMQTFEGFGPGDPDGDGVGIEVPDGQEWHYNNLGSSFTGPTSQFVEDGGYVKLREISVAYTLSGPPRWTGLTSINLRVSARNLHTWTDYTGIDPDQNLLGAQLGRGLDYFGNPNTRSLVLTARFDY